MATRRMHKVRITNPNDKDMYVDMKVYDDIAYRGPNGQMMVLSCPATQARPTIRDETGDFEGAQDLGDVATRISHIERFTDKDDPNQFFDAEILDAIQFKGPNGKVGILRVPREGGYVNDTDSIGVDSPGGTTRKGHTIKVVDKTSDTAKEDEDTDFIGVVTCDAVTFVTENGQESVLFMPNVQEIDTTVYETDDDGNPKPPENTDPNPYIVWPKDGGSDGAGPDGPWVRNGTDNFGINQGFLWQIDNAAGGKTKPWWQYEPTQQRKQWTLVLMADPYPLGYTNFRLNWYYRAEFGHGEDWAVPDPPRFPGHPIPPEGYASIDAAGDAQALSKIVFDSQPDTEKIFLGFGFYFPNIWQKTGIPQPFKKDKDGNDFIDPHTGQKVPLMPSKKLAKRVVDKYKTLWNDAANRYNAVQQSFDGHAAGISVGTIYFPYPTWDFVTPQPVPDPSKPSQRFYFIGPIPAGFNFFGFDLEAAASGYSYAETAEFGQLDEKVWDTSVDPPVRRPPPPPP